VILLQQSDFLEISPETAPAGAGDYEGTVKHGGDDVAGRFR
jgi:hypothetical protein